MKLEWFPAASRTSHSKMVLVYKILNNMCPGYLNDLLQYKTNSVYNMRSTVQRKLVIPKIRCEVFKKSLRYSGPHIGISRPMNCIISNHLLNLKGPVNNTLCQLLSPSKSQILNRSLVCI